LIPPFFSFALQEKCHFCLMFVESLLSSLYWSALEFRNWSWIVQNAELFTLTYGAIVRQLLTDLEEVEEVNKQLDQM
jgi:hypothetical protein